MMWLLANPRRITPKRLRGSGWNSVCVHTTSTRASSPKLSFLAPRRAEIWMIEVEAPTHNRGGDRVRTLGGLLANGWADFDEIWITTASQLGAMISRSTAQSDHGETRNTRSKWRDEIRGIFEIWWKWLCTWITLPIHFQSARASRYGPTMSFTSCIPNSNGIGWEMAE